MASNDGLLRVILIVIGLLVLLPMLMMAFAWPMMGMWDGHMWGVEGQPMSLWFILFLWIVPLAVILAVGYLLFRLLVDEGGHGSTPALAELRLAYARGDLTDEEFETRRERLHDEE